MTLREGLALGRGQRWLSALRNGRWVSLCGIVVAAALCLVPLLWALSTSLKPTREILHVPPDLVPRHVTLDQYKSAAGDGLLDAVRQSGVATVMAIVITLTLGTVAAYALSRFRVYYKRGILLLLVAAISMPVASLVVPIQTMAGRLGLLNQMALLVAVYVGISLPYAVWIIKTHFDSIPTQIERAAAIDGYGRTSTLTKVMLPGARPALLVAGLFTFLAAWNDYIVAAVIMQAQSSYTLQVALKFYLGTFGTQWGPLMAGTVVAVIPPLALFVIFRKYLLTGLGNGALKG